MELELMTPHDSYPSEATEMVRERVTTIERLDGVQRLRAVVERDGALHHVELVASSWGNAVHRIDTRDENLLTAVNEAVHRLERAVRRREEKQRDQQRRAGGTV